MIPTIKKLPSGSYNAVVMIDGQRISVTEETADLVAAKVMSLKAGLIAARKHPDRILLKDACAKYIDECRGRLSPTTVDGYERIVKNGFPYLMEKRICDIDQRTLQRAVNDECKRLNNRGCRYTPKTIQNRYSLIVSVLKAYGIEQKVSLPEVKDKPIFITPPEEIFRAVKGSPVELPVMLAMWLSFTMSEIRGLTKSKSIHGDQISIVETVVRINGVDYRKKGGKEQKRSRTLGLPEYIRNLIDKVEGDVIVSQTPASITNRFYRLLERAGLPHIAFHQLRHINASVMAQLQIQPQIANQRGGWSTSYVRERVYTHVFTEERKAADRKIDDYFANITNEITNEAEKNQ